MPKVFHPCCEVGSTTDYGKDGPLVVDCWNCGSPEFKYVSELDSGIYFSYYSFSYNARMVRPTDETPPWRI
jgi:hypothetical protein